MATKPPKQKKLLGLDSPDRVKQIEDRGKSHRINRHDSRRRPQSYKSISSDIDDIERLLEDIQIELDRAHVTSALDPMKSYIPRDQLPQILTPDRVRTILNMSCFKDYSDKNALTTQICFGSKGSGPRLELLAVLIAINKTKDLPKYVKEGIDDFCLPMTMDGSNDKTLSCRRHGSHKTINAYRRPNDRNDFSRWSYTLNAPHISSNVQKHMHYLLDPGDVFPMKDETKVQRNELAIVNHNGAEDMMPPAYGGFSEVLRVVIEKGHHDFGNIGVRHPGGLFALKRLTSHNRENFNLELASLLFSMDNAPNSTARTHLIQLLATFEVRGPSPSPTYYLLFDWADGNLTDFWRTNQHLVGDRGHCKWMAQQFYELCLALQCVHNQRQETLHLINGNQLARTLPGRSMKVQELYGRHGDIKPDNFLWFRTAQSSPGSCGLLALSDFGLGRLHTQVSRSLQNPKDLTWTATYRAPEFDLPNGLISRASDIFSLGCVFLEYVSWFMLGLESVERDFIDARLHRDIYDYDADTFFVTRLDEKTGQYRPFLNPKVEEWILMLQEHENCTWYLHQFLDTIKDEMLNPERSDRIDVLKLIEKMRVLRKACEVNDSFYLKTKAES
ncbi:protein kinase [Hypomontagnella monticulosa]|nr:protein kinase [Hypomontagnella monticulosa]